MNNFCKQYIKQVKMLFPLMGKQERTYIKNLTSNLEDFCEEESIQSLDELYAQFGDPADTLNNYFSSLDTADIVQRISISKCFKRIGIYLLIFTTCSVIVFGIYQYNKLKIYEKEAATFSETILK